MPVLGGKEKKYFSYILISFLSGSNRVGAIYSILGVLQVCFGVVLSGFPFVAAIFTLTVLHC